jgi:hypothetical protein
MATIIATTAIGRAAIPHATDAQADSWRIAATIAITVTVIAAVNRRCVVAIVVNAHTATVIGVPLVTVLAYITVARVDVTARQRGRGGSEDKTGDQAFHGASPVRGNTTLERSR